MLRGIAIDAGWLRTLESHGYSELEARLQFLARARESGVSMLLDHQGHIFAEYGRVLQPHSLGRKFVADIMGRGSFEFVSGAPPAACVARLRSAAFDDDDDAYVGVAANRPPSAYLTHETKHVSGDVEVAIVSCIAGVGDYLALAVLL